MVLDEDVASSSLAVLEHLVSLLLQHPLDFPTSGIKAFDLIQGYDFLVCSMIAIMFDLPYHKRRVYC